MSSSADWFGLARVWRAFFYSLEGLQSAWRQEAAFRQEILLLAIAVPAGLWFGGTGVERALLVASLLLVPLVELLNSAVEAAIDRISQERHELSKRAKDLGSAAVLIALVNAIVVWACVLVPKLHG